jgi:hypothetical protein
MVAGNRWGVVVWLAVLGLLSVAWLGGCGAERRSQLDRLPGDKQLVGGGHMIEWRAPEAGTVYLVEKTTGKIIETRSLARDDVYTFSVTSITQAEDLQTLLGIQFSRARFLLYFEPGGEAASAQP